MPSFHPRTMVQPAHVVTFLSLTAFLCCIAAEFKKARVGDLKLNGNLCSLPSTPAFGLGVASIVCLFVAQILGTSVPASRSILCITACRTSNGPTAAADAKNRVVSIALLVFSWIVFAVLLILLSTASSMNSGQPNGRGWMDGECYVVRHGVYLGGAVLVFAMFVSILGYMFTTRVKVAGGGQLDKISEAETSQKVEMEGTGILC